MNQSASEPALLAPGRFIGGCRIIREVKRGGMGCVYLAEHSTLKCPVALKTILPFQDDHRARRMFFREAQLCAQVDHPNVVVVHNAGEEQGVPYIVMRYVEGKNLSEYLQDQGGPLPWQTVLRVMRLVVRGLAAVHRKGLIHRDIKPANIMVSNEGRVLLMDFGLVRETAESSLAASSGIMGTPQFMSPEQCEGKALDPRSDIFSLGSTLYFLLTAVPPFGKGSAEMVLGRLLLRQAPQPLHLVNPSVPWEVSDLVARSMAFDPSQRFQSADELYRAMREILIRLAPLASAPPLSAVPGGDGSPSIVGPAADLAPLELVPEDLTQETPWLRRITWFSMGAITLVALASLLFVMNSGVQPAPSPVPSLENMVLIEAGNARLGMSIDRANSFLASLGSKYKPVQVDGQLLEQQELTVPVPTFWIDKYEVTNQDYLRFIQDTHHAPPPNWPGGHPGTERLQHPVTGVTVADAEAYARWAKKRLPTVAQWMRAFHGDKDTLFPWGNDFQPDYANISENDRFKIVGPVSETPRDFSHFGVYNLVGNVSELTRDTKRVRDVDCVIIKGGSGGQPGRVKGLGAFQDFLPLNDRLSDVGFRCVYEPPDPRGH